MRLDYCNSNLIKRKSEVAKQKLSIKAKSFMKIRDQAEDTRLGVDGVNMESLARNKKNSMFIKYLPSGKLVELPS